MSMKSDDSVADVIEAAERRERVYESMDRFSVELVKTACKRLARPSLLDRGIMGAAWGTCDIKSKESRFELVVHVVAVFRKKDTPPDLSPARPEPQGPLTIEGHSLE